MSLLARIRPGHLPTGKLRSDPWLGLYVPIHHPLLQMGIDARAEIAVLGCLLQDKLSLNLASCKDRLLVPIESVTLLSSELSYTGFFGITP
jgi:hypothetical protein